MFFSRTAISPRTSWSFLWKFVSYEKKSLHCWSRDFAAEPLQFFLKKLLVCGAVALGAPELQSGVGTERSNELRLAAKGGHSDGKERACAVFAGPPEFLVILARFLFGMGLCIFCARHAIFRAFCGFSWAGGRFFPFVLRFRGCGLFLCRCNLQRMCFWLTANFYCSKSWSGAEG